MSTPLERAKDFLQSLKNFLLTGGNLVDQNTANIRAVTCVRCHNNVKSDLARPKSGTCGSCGKMAEDVVIKLAKAALLQGRQTPMNAELLSCGICGCDNQLAVWFPTVPLGMHHTNVDAYPGFCWRKEITL